MVSLRNSQADSLTSERVLNVQAVYLLGSQWTPEIVRHEFNRASEIYRVCSIAIVPSEIIGIKASEAEQSLLGQSQMDIAKRLQPAQRPLVVFTQNLQIAESHGDEYVSYSPQRLLTNTSWLGWTIETPEYKSVRDPSYSTLAHELAHVLCNCGHVPPGEHNLLSGDASYVNSDITPQQCAVFREFPLLK